MMAENYLAMILQGKIHKMCWRPGLWPGPRWGSL